jgi:phosphoglycerate dehydrogenase-like enzyme
MSAAAPRLLVTLRASDRVTQAITTALPQVSWTYTEGSNPPAWGSVEAMLVGSLDRERPGFDPASTPRLAFVQRIYTGVDGFPFGRLPESVKVAGNVGAYAPFVAEHAVALALAAARTLVEANERVRRGQLRPPPEHRLLFRRSAVILGYGEIGRAIASRLAGFETRVVGVNRTGRMAPGVAAMYPADEIRSAVAEGDFVFDARPLTRSTRGSIDASVLAAMRPEAVFVNVGRAGTVDEEALYRHLTDHPTFRAALDVWWDEDFEHGRLTSRFPFAERPNFVGTPHSAGFGPGVDSYVLEKALENVARYFRGEPPRHLADRSEYLD